MCVLTSATSLSLTDVNICVQCTSRTVTIATSVVTNIQIDKCMASVSLYSCYSTQHTHILTLSRATEQYCAAGAILKPLCLSKQLTLCKQQHIDQLFPGHILCQLFANYVFLQRTTLFFCITSVL